MGWAIRVPRRLQELPMQLCATALAPGFFSDTDQTELAEKIGVHQMQVSRSLGRTAHPLRSPLEQT
jgi:DNA-directed RNA polymerase specialized sigma subunit